MALNDDMATDLIDISRITVSMVQRVRRFGTKTWPKVSLRWINGDFWPCCALVSIGGA